jgi:hypothetical protein
MLPKHIHSLQEAVKASLGCDAVYTDTAMVREVFNDETAWEGFVYVFRLRGHPKAQRCYAWSYPEGDQTKTVTVLEIPPVDSPQTAVKVAIAAKAKKC